jgi:uncharacterized protein YciI
MPLLRRFFLKTTIFAILLLIASGVRAPAQDNSDIPKGMKQYFFGFLVKGEKWSQTPPKEELDQLMKKHLAYIHSQVDAGNYKLVGPFLDDDRMRGFMIINAATAEDAQRIVSGDPVVKAGRMAVEIHPAMFADISCVRMDFEKSNGQ